MLEIATTLFAISRFAFPSESRKQEARTDGLLCINNIYEVLGPLKMAMRMRERISHAALYMLARLDLAHLGCVALQEGGQGKEGTYCGGAQIGSSLSRALVLWRLLVAGLLLFCNIVDGRIDLRSRQPELGMLN